MSIIIVLFLIGLIGGVLAGWFGIGGGVLFVVALTEYYATLSCSDYTAPQLVQLIIANSIFAVMFSGWVGSYKQYRQGTFYYTHFIPLGSVAFVALQATTYLLTHVVHFDRAAFVIIFCSLLFVLSLRSLIASPHYTTPSIAPTPAQITLVGVLAGSIVATTGLGGGAVLVPMLTIFFNYKYKKAVSISLGFIALVATLTSIVNLLKPLNSPCLRITDYYIGNINIQLLLPLIVGIIIATPLGVHISNIAKERYSKLGFFVFILIIIARLCYTTFLQ